MRRLYKNPVGKPVGKRTLGRFNCRWKDNIKTDLKEPGCNAQWWTTCEHGNEPSSSLKGGEFLAQFSYYLVIKEDSAPWSQSSLQIGVYHVLYSDILQPLSYSTGDTMQKKNRRASWLSA
jgi:hypothetical protein